MRRQCPLCHLSFAPRFASSYQANGADRLARRSRTGTPHPWFKELGAGPWRPSVTRSSLPTAPNRCRLQTRSSRLLPGRRSEELRVCYARFSPYAPLSSSLTWLGSRQSRRVPAPHIVPSTLFCHTSYLCSLHVPSSP